MNHYIGFDLGTSGARISIITDKSENSDGPYPEVYSKAAAWEAYDSPSIWMDTVESLLQSAAASLGSLATVRSICISGTSASCLIVDKEGKVTRSPRMYNFDIFASQPLNPITAIRTRDSLERHAPPKHTARSTTGSLAKLLDWNEHKPLGRNERLCHQADYVAMQFMKGRKACGSAKNQAAVVSDWHNCLKLGYNVRELTWPEWLKACLADAGLDPEFVLPSQVVSPGDRIGTISISTARKFGLPEETIIVGGTTDSNAAFLAATGGQPDLGTAVTSLGSTLAIKQTSSSYVEDADLGVYSHRLPAVFVHENKVTWLVGGASNVGCAVLRQQNFSNEELDELSRAIDPESESPLAYYPLTRTGERFPVADSKKVPCLEPVPESRAAFLHGILQGISDVERDGFLAMGALGAHPAAPKIVWTCGGGSRNDVWSQLRQRRLRQTFETDQLCVKRAENTEASFGAAILAAATY